MSQDKPVVREPLSPILQAMESARESLRKGRGVATGDAKQLAEMLKQLSGIPPSLRETALALEQADQTSTLPHLEALIGALRKAVSEQEAGQREIPGILLVDARTEEGHQLGQLLEASKVPVDVAHDTSQALSLLESRSIGLILMEPARLDMNGLAFLAKLRGMPRHALIPIIVWTAQASPKLQAEYLAAGAETVLDKATPWAVTHATVLAKLDRAREFQRVTRQDPLTGLANAEAFRKGFHRLRALCNRSGHPLSLALIQLDGFDTLARDFGHAFRDQILRHLAAILAANLRISDFPSRWRENAFTVLLPQTYPDDAVKALEKIGKAIHQHEFRPNNGKEPFRATFSAGIAEVAAPDRAQTPLDDILAEAGRLLETVHSQEGGRIHLLASQQTGRKARNILLADSDPLCVTLLSHRLELEGYRVLSLSNGVDTWKTAQETIADLVILDAHLAKVDGFDLLQRLRRLPLYKRTPIIMTGPSGMETKVERSLAFGASDYIPKPFSPLEVVARVRRLLKDRS